MQKINLEKLKELRKKRNLSQSDMAKVLGFNTLYPYHRKEGGNQPFTAEELHALANYFGVPLEYFFTNVVAKNAMKSA